MAAIILRCADFLFFARPMLLLPAATMGLLLATGEPSGAGLYLSVGAFSLLMGAAYVINQIYDRESDARNNKLGFFGKPSQISVAAAWLWYVTLCVVGVALMTPRRWAGVIPAAVCVFAGWMYSAPPIRGKDRPILGAAINAFTFAPLCWLMVHSGGSLPDLRDCVQIAAAFGAIAATHLLTTIPDIPGDAATGKRTWAVVWGAKSTLRAAITFLTISLIAAVAVRYYAFVITGVIAWPLFWRTLQRQDEKSIFLATKAPIATLTIIAAIYYPYYGLCCLFTVLLTRLYYENRWGVVYPKLS